MISIVRKGLASRARRDEGIAMVVAISLVGIVAMLVLALVTIALTEARGSGRDRQRSVSVMSAEGKIDTLMAEIQSSAPADLPCGSPASPEAQAVASDGLAVDWTVTYYDSSGTAVDCALVPTASDIAEATITATTTSDAIVGTSPARRTVETLIRLTPSYGNDLDKAIFGDAGVVVENNGTITTPDGQPTADVYSNGDVVCDGNQTYQGSIHAQGSITLSTGSSCVVAVDAHAGVGIMANDPSAVINGRALAAGGNIVIKGHLGQYARATGTASGAGCVPSTKCESGVAVPTPATETFPQITWAQVGTAWQSELGFTNIVTFPAASCGAPTGPGDKMDNVGEWIKNNASSLPGNTVLLSDCATPVYMSGIDLAFNANFAVFSRAGLKIEGNPVIKSTAAAAARNLYLMQPYDAACTSAPGIEIGNNVAFTTTANVMLYSPCDIEKRNQTDVMGQIYSGGTAYLSNKTAMTFVMLPMAGVDVTTSTVEYYDVEILYKRENL